MSKVQTTMRILRERAGLSQTDLANLLERAQPEVSMWEWGKERMPDHVRHQVFGILRAPVSARTALSASTDPNISASDLVFPPTLSLGSILNPLAPAHSRPKAITEAQVKLALEKYPSAEPACALMFPPT